MKNWPEGVTEKPCIDCGEVKARSEFHKGASKCKPCACRDSREWARNNRDRAKSNQLMKKFGITLDDYTGILKFQGGRCAICRSTRSGVRKFHVDHDHQTGKIRGLLCHLCNAGLGCLRDSPKILSAAIGYLRQPQLAIAYAEKRMKPKRTVFGEDR